MGDAGSLSLGATLAVIALITGQILVLPLIGLIFVIETMSDIIQIGYFKLSRRQARVPHGAAPPPLRARRLGRGEDHPPVLDRRASSPACSASRCSWPRSMPSPEMPTTAMTTDRPIDLDALTPRRRARGRARRPSGDGARARPQRHRARPVPRRCRAPGSRSTTAAPAAELERGDRPARRAGGRASGSGPTWTRRRPGRAPRSWPPRRRSRPTTRRPSRASGRSSRRSSPRRAAGEPDAPALVAEADLFLRLCPAPTIGVTGTKGKTTTSALAHAILAADPLHPAVLGGNIGDAADRAAARADRRTTAWSSSCPSCSSRRCRAARRSPSTPTSPPTTSTGTDRVEAYRRVKRRLAELVDPDGALVLNLEDPVVGGYAGLGAALGRALPRRPSGRRAASGVRRRLDRGRGGRAAAAGRRRDRRDAGPGGGIMPVDELGDPRAPQRVQRAGRDRRRPPVRRRARRDPARRRRASPASSTASSRSGWSTASGSSTTPRAPSPTP